MEFSTGFLYQPYLVDMNCENDIPFYISGSYFGPYCMTYHDSGIDYYFTQTIDLNSCMTVQLTVYYDSGCKTPNYLTYNNVADMGYVWVPDNQNYTTPTCFDSISYGTYVACSATQQSDKSVPSPSSNIVLYSDSACTEVYSYQQIAIDNCNIFGEFNVYPSSNGTVLYYAPNMKCTGPAYKTETYPSTCTPANSGFNGHLPLWQKVNIL